MSENHLVFARKYRPQKFQEVIYQKLTINALLNALKNDRVGHAYLFFGPRGVGKTTIARILAKRLNCANPKDNEPCGECTSCVEITKGISNDVIEIDAASNRGIDSIRELRESVKFNPMGGKSKVYIIDEVHMLTDASFNALLKTLEEPPEKVVFVLATTEYHKIPETILSRCQDFVFRKVPLLELQSYVEELCKIESIHFDQEGLFWIAKKGDGSVRDTLSFLEQAVTYTDGKLEGKLIEQMLGYQGVDSQIEFLKAVLEDTSSKSVVAIIEKLFLEGTDLVKFVWDLVEFTHTTVLVKENLVSREGVNFPLEDIQKIKKYIENFSLEVLNLVSDRVYHIYERLNQLKLRNSYEVKIFLEIQLRKLIQDIGKPSLSGILQKIKSLSEVVQKQANTLPKESPVKVEQTLATATTALQQNQTDVVEEKELEVAPQKVQENEQDVSSMILEQFSGTEIETGKYPEL
ncbi:MAG: DNA polymerase III subunit gamma/tau [Spirochaetota bacterium]